MDDAYKDQLENRTRQFAIDVIHLCVELEGIRGLRRVADQLVDAAGSVASNHRAMRRARSGREFAATAIFESHSSHLNQCGRMVDRHQRDLFVTGSAAHAMREHFAGARDEQDAAGEIAGEGHHALAVDVTGEFRFPLDIDDAFGPHECTRGNP